MLKTVALIVYRVMGIEKSTKKLSFLVRIRHRMEGHYRAMSGQRLAWYLDRCKIFLPNSAWKSSRRVSMQGLGQQPIFAAV